MEGYLGQVHRSRSKVKVTRSKNVSWDIPLTFKSRVYGPAKEETQEYDVECFQSICSFLNIYIQIHTHSIIILFAFKSCTLVVP